MDTTATTSVRAFAYAAVTFALALPAMILLYGWAMGS
jgi:hypothetical protein